MKTAIVALSIFPVLCQTPTPSADAASWQQSDQKDALRGTSYVKFVLNGRFLTPPHNGGVSTLAPTLIVSCLPGKHMRVFNGRFLNGYVSVGAILNSQISEHDGILTGKSFPEGIPVEYRLDDGKIQQENWSPSTDRTAAFFGESTLNNLLYGHVVPHKENTTAPIRKVVLAMDEYLAAEIVMQFDMPDASEIGDACGAIAHKGKR